MAAPTRDDDVDEMPLRGCLKLRLALEKLRPERSEEVPIEVQIKSGVDVRDDVRRSLK